MSCTDRLHGLYAITDPGLCKQQLLTMVQQAINGGIQVLQYRNKLATAQQQREEAHALAELCRQHDVIFIINDDVELAAEVNAHGVHIGQTDSSIERARQQLGKDKIIGISCNNVFDYALRAQEQGADYIAFGRFFPSTTKPGAPQASIDLLLRARAELQLPVVAIGGVNQGNAAELIQAGANMVAVIEGIFGQPDIQKAAENLARLFS